VSPKRTTAEAELGEAEALGTGDAEALGGGDAGTALVTGGALGTGAGTGVGTGGGGGVGAAGSGADWGAGSGAVADAVGSALAVASALAVGGADTRADGAAGGKGRPEATGATGADALAGADCACPLAAAKSPTAKQSPMLRNRSPETRADVDERTEDLTLGFGSFGHRLGNCKHKSSTARAAPEQGKCALKCPHRPLEPASENSATRVAYAPPHDDDSAPGPRGLAHCRQ
jgi:hypothetical protein